MVQNLIKISKKFYKKFPNFFFAQRPKFILGRGCTQILLLVFGIRPQQYFLLDKRKWRTLIRKKKIYKKFGDL